MKRTVIVLSSLLVVSLIACAYQFFAFTWNVVHQGHAAGQIEIFAAMHDRSLEALAEHPPDMNEAIDCLRYMHTYYTSGSIQETGTPLDRIVETTRRIASDRVVDRLRQVAVYDHGTEIEEWLRAYRHD